MVDAKLYTQPVTYPTLQAVANAKLEVDKQDVLRVKVRAASIQLTGKRASTSDPWEIQMETYEQTVVLTYGKAAVEISSDKLNWKAMADLVLKAHQRATGPQVWELVDVGGDDGTQGMNIIWTPSTTDPRGWVAATLAESKTVTWAEVDEGGDIRVIFTKGTAHPLAMFVESRTMLTNMIAHILSQTTATDAIEGSYATPAVLDYTIGNGAQGSSIGAIYTMKEIKGTADISVGNYSGGTLRTTISIPAYNGLSEVFSVRRLEDGKVTSIPSVQLDKMRKAVSAGQDVTLSTEWLADSDSFTVRAFWAKWNPASIGDNVAIIYASVANPEGVYEIDLDQENSIDVLATAAFAGVGGLVAVGTQASLEQILSESFLSTTFGQLAVTLGTTTASLISGYVSALIAAFANNWITSDQLFDLSNHVAWLKSGAANIALAAGAGVAVGSIPNLLSFFGVSNNVLSMAMNAVGGAATSAGVALGMASVMSKVVRHTYWGE